MTDTLEVPQQYVDKSKKITKLYDDFLTVGESLDQLVTELRDILVDAGFTKTQAMMKIAEDHKHLRRFSLTNIYRMLPKEEKRDYNQQSPEDIYQTLKDSNRTNLENNVTTTPEYQPSSAMEQLRKEHGTVEQEQQPQQKEWYPDEPKDAIQVKSVLELTEESLQESVKENQQLQEQIETLKSEYEKNNKVVTKPYTLEYKDQELSLICKYYYKTESFIISFDEKRLKELKKK